MRRRVIGFAALMLSLVLVLAACGTKDAGAVVKDLSKKVSTMKGYSTYGTMVLNTGMEPQKYQVEIWHQKENYYRIALTNEKKDISQIVLKNEDGVFVLTPHLNKSFRFQSEWPKNQGQVYLFESLIDSIEKDMERKFTTDEESYVFDVKANYSNASLVRQKVWVKQKTYEPQQVEIYDANNNALVVMSFNDFKFDPVFEKDSFDMQRNMTGAKLALPTLGLEEQGAEQAGSEPTAGTDKGQAAANREVSVIEPGYRPEGVNRPSVSETKLGENNAVLLRYMGSYNYTLMESQPSELSVSLPAGELVDLGFGYGVLYGDAKKTLTWVYEGTEFRLSSGDLPVAEMVNIAVSVQDQSAK